MKFFFLLLFLSSCAHYSKNNAPRINSQIEVSEIEIIDQIAIRESISTKERLLNRNGHIYKAGQSMHEELKEIEKNFSFNEEAENKVTIVYEKTRDDPLWKFASLLTLAIVPYWETIDAEYSFNYLEGKEKKQRLKSDQCVVCLYSV